MSTVPRVAGCLVVLLVCQTSPAPSCAADLLLAALDEPQVPSTEPSTKQKSDNSAELEEVVVTGSRLPIDERDNPQDLKIYTRDQIAQSGGTTLAEFLNTLPDVSLSINENGFQTPEGMTTTQIHGLPLGTTLVLLNGRRVEDSGAAQAYGQSFFDLNTIPLAAVERIELLSEGSSAIYGSDAIAGVINVVLKKDFQGLEVNSKFGFASGVHEIGADVTWGNKWDKASLAMIGSYLARTELPEYERGLTSDSDYVRYGGTNTDFYMCPNQANIYSLSGSNLPGLGAPYAGVPPGYTGTPSRQEFAATAGTLNQCSLFKYASLIPGSERASVLIEGAYEFAPAVELYGNALVSHIKQFEFNSPPILYGAPGYQQYSAGAGNPFNPFGEAVGLSDMLSSVGREVQDLGTNFFNAVVGFRGHILPSWTWDLGISDSEDRSHYTQPELNASQVQAALNSSNPATALNPFVAGPPGSSALLQSLLTQDHLNSLGRATVVDGLVRGPLVSLPAGDFQLALGGEYERQTLYQDEFYFPGPDLRTNFHRKSYAFYAEGRLPIVPAVNGSRPGDMLAITVAGRFDHDDQFGNKSTPQFGAEFRPFEPLLLRATYSEAFRAPDLIDLYAARTRITGEVLDPLKGNAIETAAITQGGNPTLQPESGLSRTFGFVYLSAERPDLRVAITQWSIEESNGIRQLPLQVIVDNAGLFPGAVTRASSCPGGPPCPITAVSATYLNFGNLNVSGLDYQLIYREHSGIGIFTPSIAATQTYRYKASLSPASPIVNAVSVAQDTGNWAPRWKGTAALDWQQGDWSVHVDARYIGRYQDYDSTRIIGNFWLADANVRYAIGQAFGETTSLRNLYLRAGSVNLFNRLPQFSNYDSDYVGYDPTQGDIRGRFLYAQLGTRW